jgi:hypothetical protein
VFLLLICYFLSEEIAFPLFYDLWDAIPKFYDRWDAMPLLDRRVKGGWLVLVLTRLSDSLSSSADRFELSFALLFLLGSTLLIDLSSTSKFYARYVLIC